MILLGHGSGGRLSQMLLEEHFLKKFDSPILARLEDSAVIQDLTLTTDAYVVSPRFFAGGDLGRLAISGTINDLCMVGADPLGISAAFILEEGFALQELDRLIASMSSTAKEAGVPVVAGDTKVVPRGACDGAFITTSALGRINPDFRPSIYSVQSQDVVIISGTIADHGMAVMTSREGIGVTGELVSDVAPLYALTKALSLAGIDVHALRDPTRGGLAQSLIEIASASQKGIEIEESSIPFKPAVRSACELMGIDPLYVANEGKMLVILPAAQEKAALDILHREPLGQAARTIGRVIDGEPGVVLNTELGGHHRLRMHSGQLLPRIC